MSDTRITDPQGRQITLHDRTWYAHILKVHLELGDCRHLAERAVSAPLEIQFSRSDPVCRVYYGKGPKPGLLMAVVADVVAGVVKTAHLAGKVTGGGMEWSSPTPSKE
jgi:hypothetical protein